MDFVTKSFLPAIEEDIAKQYETIQAFVMGRKTFDKLASYWPTEKAKDERLVDLMNGKTKLVFSVRPQVSGWQNSESLGPNPMQALEQHKKNGTGDLMILGSASLVQVLMAKGWIDEFRFLVFPTILGKGRPLFHPEAPPLSLELIREHRFDNGVLALHYWT